MCFPTVKRNRQVIRVQVKAAENVDEAKLKELVLSKVNFVILIWLELGLIVEHTV